MRVTKLYKLKIHVVFSLDPNAQNMKPAAVHLLITVCSNHAHARIQRGDRVSGPPYKTLK